MREPIIHGQNCQKMPHARSGMLHDESDDSPYDVDGVKYCGRCHWTLSPAELRAARGIPEHSEENGAELMMQHLLATGQATTTPIEQPVSDTPTPRTDNAAWPSEDGERHDWVRYNFARTLERELAAARAEVRVLEDKMPWKEDFDRLNEQLSVARSEHAELTLALQRQIKNAIDASVSEASLRRENAELLERNTFLEQFTPKTNLALCAELLEAKARAEAAEAERDKFRERLSEECRLSESAISFANMLEPKLKAALARAEAAEAAVTKLRSSLENIAAQKLSSELAPDDRSDVDFEGGYDEAVTQARHAALFQTEPKPEDGKLTQ